MIYSVNRHVMFQNYAAEKPSVFLNVLVLLLFFIILRIFPIIVLYSVSNCKVVFVFHHCVTVVELCFALQGKLSIKM